MQFTKEQVAAFGRQQRDAFLLAVIDMCRDTLPEHCGSMKDAELRVAVATSVRDAEATGLRWKSNLATTCLLDIRYQRPVLAEPEVKEHLANATTPDRVFRHLFVGELAEVWTRLDEGGA